ncbi:hypothetical protein A0H81_11037 [Grifola frondosa]|uniref:Uncharacterized protein n=1 Tax=Grifola frondosa TaxID=5627 RepID=A0A1C7LXD0_GRIFR|nr:hypothetical protein A0H81_11037 [Grifola frondosa]
MRWRAGSTAISLPSRARSASPPRFCALGLVLGTSVLLACAAFPRFFSQGAGARVQIEQAAVRMHASVVLCGCVSCIFVPARIRMVLVHFQSELECELKLMFDFAPDPRAAAAPARTDTEFPRGLQLQQNTGVSAAAQRKALEAQGDTTASAEANKPSPTQSVSGGALRFGKYQHHRLEFGFRAGAGDEEMDLYWDYQQVLALPHSSGSTDTWKRVAKQSSETDAICEFEWTMSHRILMRLLGFRPALLDYNWIAS